MSRLIKMMIILSMFPLFLAAQQSKLSFEKRQMPAIQKAVTVDVESIQEDWAPVLEHMEMPAPGHDDYEEYLIYLKEQLPPVAAGRERKTGAPAKTASIDPPEQLREFEGNQFQGIPNDNDLAISNDELLVSVTNSRIYMFDVQQDTFMKQLSLAAFADTLNIPSHKYDPKVKYDPQEDRFIMVFLSGNTDSTSHIITAFSVSNDPTGEWNLYSLDGNPYQAGHWSDYPMMAVNEEELFITVNLIETGESWQEGFYQSLVWQIDKMDGFNGDSLSSTTYGNITYGGGPIRNLRPVQYGDGLSGKEGVYLLSNRNFATTNDTIFLMEVTGGLDDPSSTVDFNMLKVSPAYGLAPDGQQDYGGDLQTNDSRILGAFVHNNTIQYVQTTRDPQNGRSSAYHGVITNLDRQNPVFHAGHIISEDTLDFGYPNIAYTGRYPGDGEAIINFLHTDSTTEPGSSAMFYDGRGNYSERIVLKEGSSFVDVLGGSKERWGDYTGTQPKYNEPGKVWVAGSFGEVVGELVLNPRATGTWITELASPDTTTEPPVGIPSSNGNNRIVAYPNPTSHVVTVEFRAERTETLHMRVLNMNGEIVKTLLGAKVKKGRNRFSFSTEPLSAGVYLLTVEGQNGRVFSKKITVSR